MMVLMFEHNVFDGQRQDGLPYGCSQVQYIEDAFGLVVIACGGEVFRKANQVTNASGKGIRPQIQHVI